MKKLFLAGFIVIGMVASLPANPVPEIKLAYVKAYPPEIGVICYIDIDLNGDSIVTSSGSALITNFVFPGYEQMFVFDSSNTTGFTINPEADYAYLPTYYWDEVHFGNYGIAPSPIRGHSIRHTWGFPGDAWSFDFTHTEWSLTSVVINEINANCDWGPEANFIELYNQGDSAFDISGWMVICDTICTIPPNTVIEGHGFYVIDQCDFPDIYDMDFDADNIYLVRADNNLVDQVGWSSNHGANVSFMRYPDGEIDTTIWPGYTGYDDQSSCTFENGIPTRGAPNRHASPGFVVIGTHASGDTGVADIGWTNPVWDPTYDYSVVVRNFNDFPQDPNDGVTVYQGTDQQFTEIGLPGTSVIHYTAFARDTYGDYSIPTDESRAFIVMGIAGIDEGSILPENISRLECYPNPFNASVTIDFVLIQAGPATLSIYNLRGQRVEALMESSISAGEHRITWDGSRFPSGVYFARLETSGSSRSIKMVLLK